MTTQSAGGTDRILQIPFVARSAGRDFAWRYRRWVISTIGTGVAFSVALLLAGFLASFDAEVERTLDAIGGDGYIVANGSPGPFTTQSPVPAALERELAATPGIERVSPLITLPYNLTRAGDDEIFDTFLVGRRADGPGVWPIDEGRAPSAPGEVVLDKRSHPKLGEEVLLGGVPFTVVGMTSGIHVIAGKGAAWVSVEDAQQVLFKGQPFVSGYVIDGRPSALPDGTHFIDRATGRADLLRLVKPVIKSITTFRLLMWIVAAAIVGSVLYLTALDRVRDFAVFKAIGVRDRELVASLLAQAVLLAAVASLLATAIAFVLAPTFPTPVLFTARVLIGAPLLALVIGGLGSLAGVQRAISTDPAIAFGGA
jgi:putative ABC transport system permease protein